MRIKIYLHNVQRELFRIMIQIAKWIIFCGIFLIVFGLILWGASKVFPLGKLPGDIRVHREKFSLYFPIISSLVISLVLTIVINLIFWLFRK